MGEKLGLLAIGHGKRRYLSAPGVVAPLAVGVCHLLGVLGAELLLLAVGRPNNDRVVHPA